MLLTPLIVSRQAETAYRNVFCGIIRPVASKIAIMAAPSPAIIVAIKRYIIGASAACVAVGNGGKNDQLFARSRQRYIKIMVTGMKALKYFNGWRMEIGGIFP